MVVFGAGASFDSSPDYRPSEDGMQEHWMRPPLADHLFELRPIFTEAARRIPKCQAIITQLRYRQSDMSAEQQLENLRDQAVNYPEGQRQLVSVRFYLQWIMSRCQKDWNAHTKSMTNYRTLLGQIDRQLKGNSVCLVTFNYDTLLEEAFTSLDRRFKTLGDYVSRDDYKVIKLHGSIDWAHEIASTMQLHESDPVDVANKTIMNADKFELSDRYHFAAEELHRVGPPLSYMEKIPGKDGRQAVFPAIAVPFEKKTEFECPTEHVREIEGCISHTDRLVIIGWKASEERFLKLLAKMEKNIPKMIVSSNRDSADKIKSKLQDFGIDGGPWSLSDAGFTDTVKSGRIENFIHSL
jgi:hypothetical protein